MDEALKFLHEQNFTKGSTTATRPPVIGEENDVTDVDGRMLQHTSISGKFETSVATPRRPDKDLGFEPEGSASPLPVYDQWRSSLQNVLDDSEGIRLFQTFLADSKEEKLLNCWLACKGFRDMGMKSDFSNNLSAASSAIKPDTAQTMQTDGARLQKRRKLAKVIFNAYLKDKCAVVTTVIDDATRQRIVREIKKALLSSYYELDTCLFDEAQNEIEMYIEEHCYVSFLNSDLLKKYVVQCETEQAIRPSQIAILQNDIEKKIDLSDSPRAESTADAAASNRFPSLSPLDEGQVWDPPVRAKSESANVDKDQSLNSTMSSGVSQSALARQTMKRNMAVNKQTRSFIPSDSPDQNRPAYAYLVAPSANRYYVPPASANASDNVSSDATCDTLSFTDGSLDLEPCNPKKNQKRLMRRQMKRNSIMCCSAEENFISRTRCNYKPKQATLATENPGQFFTQLKEKMDKVVDERRRIEFLDAVAPDNMEEILDDHIGRVGHMKTPNPADSPVRSRSPPHNVAPDARGVSQSNSSEPRYTIMEGRDLCPPRMEAVERAATPRKRADFAQKRKNVNGMASNEVPDVMQVPVPTVDKNSFIQEWIKQQDSVKCVQPQHSAPQPRRDGVFKSGRLAKLVNSSDGLSASRGAATTRADPNLRNTLDEAKRRPNEGTEERWCARSPLATVGSCSAFDNKSSTAAAPSSASHSRNAPVTSSGMESVSQTAVDTALVVRPRVGNTTCIYFMRDEVMAYKIQIPHDPVTLAQFKFYARRKGDFRYFFKQYSPEIYEPVFYEVMEDDEALPVWENTVVAMVKANE